MGRAALLPALALAAALALPPAAADPAFHAHTLARGESPEAIATHLIEALGGAATVRMESGIIYIDYAGLDFPAALRDLVADRLDPSVAALLAPGLPVNASLAISRAGTGSDLRLLLATPDAAEFSDVTASPGAGLPEGATILMGGGSAETCTGQLVLSQPAALGEAAPLYARSLAAEGFRMSNLSDGSTSFFVGHRPGCALFLYLQAEPDAATRSTVVINFQGD